jgi:hypothetical protein
LRDAGARQRLAATYNKAGRAQEHLQDFDTARAAFRQAMALTDPEATTTNPSVQAALHRCGFLQWTRRDRSAALGAESRQGQKNRVEHWQQAVSWYKHSLEIWGRIKDPGTISPDGFDVCPPSVVSRRRAQSKTVLAQLRLGYWPPKSSRRA